MSGAPTIRSTADAQRARITSAAIRVFARKGFHATPVADVASEAGVSPAYAFRLFGDKEGLFVAAARETYARVASTMTEAGTDTAAGSAQARLDAMTRAYVELVTDRDLILMQAHAQASCGLPAIRSAVQDGLEAVVSAVADTSGAEPAAVQRFMAYGQLCHLIVQSDLTEVHKSWAGTLVAGITHRRNH